jgi:hypothetical protein
MKRRRKLKPRILRRFKMQERITLRQLRKRNSMMTGRQRLRQKKIRRMLIRNYLTQLRSPKEPSSLHGLPRR